MGDASHLVATGRYDLPYSIYLVSDASAVELSEDLTAHLGTRGRFPITEISENRQGFMPAETTLRSRWNRMRPKQ